MKRLLRLALLAGLVDEIQVDIMPVLLGEGLRLYEHIGARPIDLEEVWVSESGGRTSIRFRVVKAGKGHVQKHQTPL